MIIPAPELIQAAFPDAIGWARQSRAAAVAMDDSFPFNSRRSPVYGTGGMVVAAQPLAVAAGLATLVQGGTAADAAVATAAALNVTQPTSTGIGGDCFALYFEAVSREVTALNGSGRAPQALTLAHLQAEGYGAELPPFHPYTITVPGAYRVYGSPRMHQELVARGFACSLNRVARLMHTHQIRAQAGQHRRRAISQTASTWVAPNVLAGCFQAPQLNQVWLADITYVWTQTGWLYLAVVMDLCSRRIIGWSMSTQPTSQLALNALHMALQHRQPPPHTVLHHSDRGIQYACKTYQECLHAHQIQASMSRRGVCYDNAVVESFFHSLKTERVSSQSYPSQAAARHDLFDYVEIFYNRNRRHSALGYVSPAEFEATLLNESLLSVST